MSKPPDNVTKFDETLTICEYTDPKNVNFGFWLYDKTQGMHLAMQAKTESAAFLKALRYYQGRLAQVEGEYKTLKRKVDAFVAEFVDDEEQSTCN